MDTKLLKIFLKVCELGSFTKAAKDLNYAQSSVSESIQSLEALLGKKLFERLSRKIYLTDDGKTLIKYANKICQTETQMLNHFDQHANSVINIGITESLAAYKFPTFFRTFLAHHPHLSIHFEMLRCEEIPEHIRSNTIDIGFSLDNKIVYKDIVDLTLFEEEIIFLTGSNDPMEADNFKALSPYNPIISKGQTGYNKLFYDICTSEGLTLSRPIYLESLEGIKAYVKGGFGYTFLPLTTVEKELSTGELKSINPLNKTYHQEVQILYHKDKYMDEHIKALIEFSVATYGQIHVDA
jgi:DNA-binding transcriptional LysR family regulator